MGPGVKVGGDGRGVFVGVEGIDVGVAVAGRGVGLGAAVEVGREVGVCGWGVGRGSDVGPGMTVDAPVGDGAAVDCDVGVDVCLAVHAAIRNTVKSVGNSGDRCLSMVFFNRYPLCSTLSSVSQRCSDQAWHFCWRARTNRPCRTGPSGCIRSPGRSPLLRVPWGKPPQQPDQRRARHGHAHDLASNPI